MAVYLLLFSDIYLFGDEHINKMQLCYGHSWVSNVIIDNQAYAVPEY